MKDLKERDMNLLYAAVRPLSGLLIPQRYQADNIGDYLEHKDELPASELQQPIIYIHNAMRIKRRGDIDYEVSDESGSLALEWRVKAYDPRTWMPTGKEAHLSGLGMRDTIGFLAFTHGPMPNILGIAKPYKDTPRRVQSFSYA
jgi:hypothetical protein